MRTPLFFFFNRHLTTQPHHHNLRTLFDATSFKPVRDRGLDHAVEREKHLQPLINLKNLILLEPSKSLPISLISDQRHSLQLPFRPIDFVRHYPSVFHDFLPLPNAFHPHIRLTPQALHIHAHETFMYRSDAYKQQLAHRLLKLLMIARVHKIPLSIIDLFRWDLGLPQDYEKSFIPEFPDCFRVVRNNDGDDRVLELVCWNDELAVSVIEKKNKNDSKGGKEIEFPVKFSTGFEKDKNYEKWLSEWQRLPYVSPYEDASSYLSASSDESDRWVVGVLHEILHILVPKKTEKDNVLVLGDWLGLRSRFKRALLRHPGIFYVSSKIGTYTVVVRDGYKRGSLVEKHPLMDLRSQYVHLMNTVVKKEDSKTSKVEQGKSTMPKETNDKDKDKLDGRGEEDAENGGEESDAEAEDASESDFDAEEEKSRRRPRRMVTNSRGREVGRLNLNTKKPLRDSHKEKSAGKFTQRTREKYPGEISKRIRMLGGRKDVESSQKRRSRFPKSEGMLLNSKKTPV
ncbi:hypothetical protein RIF29_18493 [Crotalaria pallida]|uniref:PORR domain-containing protein n=1 Tax=Crotalaria pallida TaxID=3830 RepID=A0AAN9IFI2_CROPI